MPAALVVRLWSQVNPTNSASGRQYRAGEYQVHGYAFTAIRALDEVRYSDAYGIWVHSDTWDGANATRAGYNVNCAGAMDAFQAANPPAPTDHAGWQAAFNLGEVAGGRILQQNRYGAAVFLPGVGMYSLEGANNITYPRDAYRKAVDWWTANAQGNLEIIPWVMCNPYEDTQLPSFSPETTDDHAPAGVFTMPSPDTIRLPYDHEVVGRRSCSTCGRTGHNARTCTYTPKTFDRVGVEIEGRFLNLSQRREIAASLGAGGSSDGSIRHGRTAAEAWEFKTLAGSVSQAHTQIHALYPDEADSSMGMHIHVSFAPVDIAQLCSVEFFAYFKQRWTAWGTRLNVHPDSEFWKRLNGDNSYCQVNTTVPPDLENMDRYHQINFSSWSSHRTVECRLLPMFRKEALAHSAVDELISIYEDWFALLAATPIALTDVELPDVVRTQEHTTEHIEGGDILTEHTTEHIEMGDLPPPAEGLTRVALPTGRVMGSNLSGPPTYYGFLTQIAEAA